MPTHLAFKIMSGQNDQVFATVWWDGEHIRSDSESFLKKLRKESIGIYEWRDGEKFFKSIPQRYSNGYIRCKKTQVDESGKEV